jgi:hypothetical protein
MRKDYVFGIGQREVGPEHMLPAPGDKLRVHFSNQDQRRFLQMPDLEQLPASSSVPMPPGMTIKASDISTN